VRWCSVGREGKKIEGWLTAGSHIYSSTRCLQRHIFQPIQSYIPNKKLERLRSSNQTRNGSIPFQKTRLNQSQPTWLPNQTHAKSSRLGSSHYIFPECLVQSQARLEIFLEYIRHCHTSVSHVRIGDHHGNIFSINTSLPVDAADPQVLATSKSHPGRAQGGAGAGESDGRCSGGRPDEGVLVRSGVGKHGHGWPL
jgi:hypothetical protein